MKLFTRRALVALLTCCIFSSTRAIQIQDDRGVNLQLTQAPQRIVSLLPSLTESVCALGQCQRLVGVDRYSNYPASVRALPQLGGGLDPHIEAIVALKPDLVLMATSARAAERLRSLGIKVLSFEPKSLADVQRVLGLLGQVLQVNDAPRVWHELEVAVAAAAQSVPAGVRAARVYFEVGDGSYAASPDSFIGEILTRLGVQNITPKGLGPFPKLNPEFVVRADPDVIMMGERSSTTLEQRPGWAGLRAVRAHHVCAFSHEQSDVLARAGPRMAQAAQIMAQCLRGVGKER